MSSTATFDEMEMHALAEPNRLITLIDRVSHPDTIVRKHFRSSFGRYFNHPPGRMPLLAAKCPFCSAALLTKEETLVYEDGPEINMLSSACVRVIDDSFDLQSIDLLDPCNDHDTPEFSGAIEYCRSCRYWRFHYTKTDTFPRGCGLTLAYSSIAAKRREYEGELPDGVSEELAVWLRRTPAGWYTMNTRRFEQLVADVFRRNHSTAEVTHVGRPDDGGVDVLLVESDGRQWLIQAKRRESPHASEGISTVRNLLGAMVLEGARHGAVVSTADHFSYRACLAVGRARERGMVLRLIDKRAFDRLLEPLLPDRPWLAAIMTRFPFFGRHFANRIESERQPRLFD